MKPEEIDEELFRYQLPKEAWLLNKYTEFEEFLDECKKQREVIRIFASVRAFPRSTGYHTPSPLRALTML